MATKAFYTVLSVLFAILGWIGQQTYFKLVDVEKELVTVKIELVKIQSEMITRDDVLEIVKNELAKQK